MTGLPVAIGGIVEGRPRLRADVRMVEQTFEGERSVVVKDPATGKYYRMRLQETRVLRLFDGTRSAAEVARALAAEGIQLGEAAVERFARGCARLGLLERSLAERTTLQLERLREERRRQRSLFRGELMRMRWSVGNPDALIARAYPWLRWCFGRPFVVASLALFAAYFAVILLAWPEFARALLDVADLGQLGAGRVATYVIVTALVIVIHELGHAFACKHFGGEVSELGFMLIYLQPAFYCNVNDAWSFPELRARLWVTAAGMWIQMVIAGLAAIAWWVAAPGTFVAEVALAAMIAGGMTSVLTNANPLLPLDGYFALIDWLEVPNLRQRGLAWAGWWVRTRVLGLDLPEPASTARERRILAWYGGLAAAYITVMLAAFAFIVLRAAAHVAGTHGLVLAGLLLALMLGRTVQRWGSAIVHGVRRRLAGTRGRGRRALVAALVLVVVGALPWQGRVRGPVRAAGVHDAVLAMPAAGLVTAVLAREGDRVPAGAPLLHVADAATAVAMERLAREADSLLAATRDARARLATAEAGVLDAAWRARVAERAAMTARAARVLRAPAGGEVVTLRPERLLGRRLAAGDAALRLVDADSVEVRVAVAGVGASLVRPGHALWLVSLVDPSRPARTVVTSVAASDGAGGRVEVRARLPRDDTWRPGVTGEAQVLLDRTTIAGAAWRALRGRMRGAVML